MKQLLELTRHRVQCHAASELRGIAGANPLALQNTLEQHAGSIARKVVPRAVSAATSYDELVNHLAGYILNLEDEIEFRARATDSHERAATQAYTSAPGSRSNPRNTPTISAQAGAPTSLQAAVFTKAQSQLAQFVGPIAAVPIEEAAQTIDTSQFHALLAQEIDDPADRSKFLAAVK